MSSTEERSEKFTAGPWVVQNGGDVFTQERYGNPMDGHQIADCKVDYESDDNAGLPLEEQRANAHLIAAAPDMYEALSFFLADYLKMVASGDCGFWNPDNDDVVVKARAALAKARGEAVK